MKISQRGWKTGIVINISVVILLDFMHDGGRHKMARFLSKRTALGPLLNLISKLAVDM